MKTKLLFACGLTLALAACSEQHKADTTPALTPAATTAQSTESPMVKTDTSTVAAKTMTTLPVSDAPMPDWAMQKNQTVAPIGNRLMDGQKYHVKFACKPNDCGSDFLYTMTNDVNKQAYSLVVHVKDVNGAITAPSQYATYWFMGDPDTQTKVVLQKILEANPNWK